MIGALKPYPAVRNTDLPWAPSIPEHWDVRRNGRLFWQRKETGFPELPVLEVSLRTGVRVRDFDNGARKQQMADRSAYKRAAGGDIAYNMMRMWQGAVGIAPSDGLVSPAYVVAAPYPEVSAAYYAYLFRTALYLREVDSFSRGIVPDRNRLYWEAFKQIPSLYPPLEEQGLIVRFLDWHGAMTARLIRAKKRLIALLNEQKQAIIHQAVTRGLDPDVKRKDGGVDWLTSIPKHWGVKRLRRVCRIGPSVGASHLIDNQIVSFLPMECVATDGSVDFSITKNGSEAGGGFSAFARDDVILAKITPCFENGKGAVLSDMPTEIGFGSTEFIVLRAGAGILPRYLYLLVMEPKFRQLGIDAMTGTAGQQRISPDFVGNHMIAVPPLSEQHAILKHVDASMLQISIAIADAETEIRLIQEFHTRLIAETVTGKVDVRSLAMTLPTVARESFEKTSEDKDLEGLDLEDEELAA